MAPSLPIELAALLLGLLFGSFLNVCITRLPRGESIVHPRSRCRDCGDTIRWYDNIPLLSFALLRRRCRACHAPIPWRYPLVEIATAAWFVLTTALLLHGLPAATTTEQLARLVLSDLAVLGLGFCLIGLMVMDWQTQTLPDAFTITGACVGFALACIQAGFLATGEGDIHLNPHHQLRLNSPGSFASRGDVFLTGPEAAVLGRLLAILAAAGVLYFIRAIYRALRHRDGIGLGDAKLLAMIAGFLGFSDAMLSFFLGMVACAIYAVYLLARGKATPTTRLPLGSFLAAGGLITALAGEAVLTWYKGFL